ncbi:carbohydrate ABC transporter permease [Ilumatobacter coccineus]|jgi:alpha-glucoside transport system permease protein|uniref:Putative alpha-glucoside ABC transporter permease protein n=1 Tax=Ilumatobacter coccineus (strain NBRC 103263 / KCTC 29153 / YM16-304) TaxID=1313172 RepID=A0A6C7E807_ILUCY|nr:carbohydrate ABC transporter permease [Ilumatobacter coccineus]BAN01339.1 putative alpha-glucoside ABC transporter permease protein [Ilumatobacter coccineus YM16-304]
MSNVPLISPSSVGSDAASSDSGFVTRVYSKLRGLPMWVLWGIVVVWSLPTIGLAVSGFRSRDAQRQSGWWTAGFDDGSLENYRTIRDASASGTIGDSLLNSMAIAIPATIIPIAIAAFAAYAFAWIDFKGRKGLFIATVALLAVPLQVALIPLLQLYVGGSHLTIPLIDKTITLFPDLDLQGTAAAVWLTHTGFALPFAIFLLHNYISGLPGDVFEAARIDGADHFTIFWRLVLPLSVPVLAAFAIFQFLWTWNDYLVANTFAGNNKDARPTTILIANLAGDFGANEHLLPAAAFVQAFFPLIVFFALQRFFVRGLLAGSVKG